MFLSALMTVLAAVPPPMAVVQAADAEIQKVLASKDRSSEKLALSVDRYVDFFELAKRAFGKSWKLLNQNQQDEFGAVIKGLLRASYAQKVISKDLGHAKKVEYNSERVEQDEATVKTMLHFKEGRFPVIYKLHRPDPKKGWKIFDVINDGVSLVATYSDQFRKIIAQQGFDGLLKLLRKRQQQLEKRSVEL